MSGLPSDWFCPVRARRLYALVERISGYPVDVPSLLSSNMTTLYSAATCIEHAAVSPDGEWISYGCTMSERQLQVEPMLNLEHWIMLPEDGGMSCNSTMHVRQLQVQSALNIWMFWMGIICCYRYIHWISAWTMAQWLMEFKWSYGTMSSGAMER